MDIKQIALELELLRQPMWVERWKRWVLVQELTGEERADLLQQCTSVVKKNGKREGKVDLKKMFPMLAILSLRNPDASVLPDKSDPNYPKYPGATDASGNYFTPPCEKPGELVFEMTDLVGLNKRSGAVLEQISTLAQTLSGLREEDIDEKKGNSEESGETDNTVETTGYPIE